MAAAAERVGPFEEQPKEGSEAQNDDAGEEEGVGEEAESGAAAGEE